MDCDKCKCSMRKDATLNSGNVKYEKYICPQCNEVKMHCLGIDN